MIKKNGVFLNQLEQVTMEYKSHAYKSSAMYKLFAEKFGVSPWKVIIPIALILGFFFVFIFKGLAVEGVSILQWGF